MKIRRPPVKATKISSFRLSVFLSLSLFSGAIARCHRRSSFSLSLSLLLGGRFQQHLEGARLTILFGKQQITVSLFFVVLFFYFSSIFPLACSLSLSFRLYRYLPDGEWRLVRSASSMWWTAKKKPSGAVGLTAAQTNFPIHSKMEKTLFERDQRASHMKYDIRAIIENLHSRKK